VELPTHRSPTWADGIFGKDKVVEGTIAWLHGFRRLRVRWERRGGIAEAFLGLATCSITHRQGQRLC
jgi:hypothetical protein